MIAASACMIGHSRSQSRLIDKLLGLTISTYINTKTENLSSAAVDWGLWSETMSYVKGEESDFFSNNFDESSLSFTEFMVIRSRDGSYHSSATWDNESSNVISVRQSVSDAIASTSVNDCGVAFVAPIDSDNYLIASGRIHSSTSPEDSHGCIYFGKRLDPDFGLKSPGFSSIKTSVGITDIFLAPANRSAGSLRIDDLFFKSIRVNVQEWNSLAGENIYITRFDGEASAFILLVGFSCILFLGIIILVRSEDG